MNKKAQFFLIAALIIAAVILALSQVYSESRTSEQESYVYDFSNEVYYEASQVIDNGVFNSNSNQETTSRLESLTEYYAKSNPDSDIVILYGDENSFSEIRYDASVGSQITNSPVSSQFSPEEIIDSENNVKKIPIVLEDKENPDKKIKREFEVKKGQNFYIVIRKKIQNEQFVIAR